MFLVNSRYPRFSATPKGSRREVLHPQGHTFSRSYGVNLPSSLTRVLSSALGCSPHPPVSVYGTVTTAVHSRGAFLGSRESPSCPRKQACTTLITSRHWTSVCGLKPPENPAYWLERPSIRPLGYPPPSPLVKPSVTGAGIFACFPSTTHLCLALGAD